jgi:hypothetical protein
MARAGSTDMAGAGSTDLAKTGDLAITGDTTCNPTFGGAMACGGDVTGAWTYKSVCTNDEVFADLKTACAGLSGSNEAVASSGALTLSAGGTYSRQANTTLSGNANFPSSCVAPLGGCTGVETYVKSTYSGASATCAAGVSSSCDCTLSIPVATNDSGTYTVVGATLTAHPSGGGALTYSFCSQGNVLKYKGDAGNSVVTERFSYVLTR